MDSVVEPSKLGESEKEGFGTSGGNGVVGVVTAESSVTGGGPGTSGDEVGDDSVSGSGGGGEVGVCGSVTSARGSADSSKDPSCANAVSERDINSKVVLN